MQYIIFFKNKNLKTINSINYILNGNRNSNLLNNPEDNRIILNYKKYLSNEIFYYFDLKNKIDNKYFYNFINN